MKNHARQLTTPLDAIVFDCDGTLSCLEGIDELAQVNGVEHEVAALTQKAMGVTGITPDLYAQRLSLVQPTETQIKKVGHDYFYERTPDVLEVIQIFQRFNKVIYIMSAGVNPAVIMFAERLGIPKSQVFAVDLQFDAAGAYLDYDHQSPLTSPGGKRDLVELLHKKHRNIMHIGDGMNDIDAKDVVTRFVGYGGVFYREKIAELCDYYILSTSMSSLLPLALTEKETQNLSEGERQFYDAGMLFIERGEVLIK